MVSESVQSALTNLGQTTTVFAFYFRDPRKKVSAKKSILVIKNTTTTTTSTTTTTNNNVLRKLKQCYQSI